MAKQSRQAESYTRALTSKGAASGKTGVDGGRATGRGRRRGPNLRDVAKAADVSVATVSLVLNDSQRISRATKVKVRRMMDELGYQPNRLAQSLSGKYTMVLAVLLPDLQGAFADAYFGTLVSGIVDAAHARGYKVLLEQAKPDYVEASKHVERFERRYTD
ncbi:MAG: LacI family DNA-binding transcriptional regulator, partial [Planctomycetota bacterium]